MLMAEIAGGRDPRKAKAEAEIKADAAQANTVIAVLRWCDFCC